MHSIFLRYYALLKEQFNICNMLPIYAYILKKCRFEIFCNRSDGGNKS
jgi:hypothetical protein